MTGKVFSENELKETIKAGVAAPSPDNNQPWLFDWDSHSLLLCLNLREALPSDVKHMFDLLSAGAVIENMSLAASEQGWRLEVEPLEEQPSGDTLPVASISFKPGGSPDPLFSLIPLRSTNRQLFSTKVLADSLVQELSESVRDIPGVSATWVVDPAKRAQMGRVIAIADRFRFEYPAFHAEIFRQLRFTREEVERTRDGLDYLTLALPPGSKPIIRALRSWRIMKGFNSLGLSQLLTMPTIWSVKRCGALALLSVDEPSLKQYILAGRAMQRLWLAATKAGLSVHPLGSLPIFLAHELVLQGEKLTSRHRALARWLAGRLEELVPQIRGRTLVLVLRLGYAPPPKIRSLRRPVESFFINARFGRGNS